MFNSKEEYFFSEVSDYLKDNISLLIIGPQKDERTKAVYNSMEEKVDCISIEYLYEEEKFQIIPLKCEYMKRKCDSSDLGPVLSSLKRYEYEFKNILLDITSLQTPTLIMLCRVLLSSIDCKPAKLFTAYAKPEKYISRENCKYMFSRKFGPASSVPGFISRARDKEILVPFLGFEGVRLRNIIGDTQYSSIVPIIGCPSDDPKWQFETMRNCMEEIREQDAQANIEKCKANSIFEAYYLLERLVSGRMVNYVLAPLGTKPHTVAIAIFTIKHKTNCRLIYDYAVENYEQSVGIHNILVSHISCFL